MDDEDKKPKVFANHVIQQLVSHLFGGDMVVEYEDYLALRTLFRSSGGSWWDLWNGDTLQFEILKKLVSAWGQMPERIRESDRLI